MWISKFPCTHFTCNFRAAIFETQSPWDAPAV